MRRFTSRDCSLTHRGVREYSTHALARLELGARRLPPQAVRAAVRRWLARVRVRRTAGDPPHRARPQRMLPRQSVWSAPEVSGAEVSAMEVLRCRCGASDLVRTEASVQLVPYVVLRIELSVYIVVITVRTTPRPLRSSPPSTRTHTRARMHTRTHAQTHTGTLTYMHAQTRGRTRTNTHARTHAHSWARTHSCGHGTLVDTQAHTQTCTHEHSHAHTGARARIVIDGHKEETVSVRQ